MIIKRPIELVSSDVKGTFLLFFIGIPITIEGTDCQVEMGLIEIEVVIWCNNACFNRRLMISVKAIDKYVELLMTVE